MKCLFCGELNPDGATVCIACKRPLNVREGNNNFTVREEGGHDLPTQLKSNNDIIETPVARKHGFDPKATVREFDSIQELEPVKHSNECPNCGYELDDDGICANCGKQLEKESPEKECVPNFKKTVRPQHKSRFHSEEEVSPNFNLSLVSDNGERLFTMNYKGREVILNRENTEKENNTITSQKQATIKLGDDGKWVIVDNSEMQSTFVQAAHPIRLEHGDYILLGDRIFRFELE